MTQHQDLPGAAARVLAQLALWFAGLFFTILAGLVMSAPYFVSVIANIGRRPVVFRRASAPRRRLAAPRRSALERG